MSSTIERVELTAPDISCGHCVATVTREVGAVPGVAAVDVDLPTKQVTVAYDPGRVSVAQIEAALDEAGYPVAQ